VEMWYHRQKALQDHECVQSTEENAWTSLQLILSKFY